VVALGTEYLSIYRVGIRGAIAVLRPYVMTQHMANIYKGKYAEYGHISQVYQSHLWLFWVKMYDKYKTGK
jgi:hypothetical protein